MELTIPGMASRKSTRYIDALCLMQFGISKGFEWNPSHRFDLSRQIFSKSQTPYFKLFLVTHCPSDNLPPNRPHLAPGWSGELWVCCLLPPPFFMEPQREIIIWASSPPLTSNRPAALLTYSPRNKTHTQRQPSICPHNPPLECRMSPKL